MKVIIIALFAIYCVIVCSAQSNGNDRPSASSGKGNLQSPTVSPAETLFSSASSVQGNDRPSASSGKGNLQSPSASPAVALFSSASSVQGNLQSPTASPAETLFSSGKGNLQSPSASPAVALFSSASSVQGNDKPSASSGRSNGEASRSISINIPSFSGFPNFPSSSPSNGRDQEPQRANYTDRLPVGQNPTTYEFPFGNRGSDGVKLTVSANSDINTTVSCRPVIRIPSRDNGRDDPSEPVNNTLPFGFSGLDNYYGAYGFNITFGNASNGVDGILTIPKPTNCERCNNEDKTRLAILVFDQTNRTFSVISRGDLKDNSNSTTVSFNGNTIIVIAALATDLPPISIGRPIVIAGNSDQNLTFSRDGKSEFLINNLNASAGVLNVSVTNSSSDTRLAGTPVSPFFNLSHSEGGSSVDFASLIFDLSAAGVTNAGDLTWCRLNEKSKVWEPRGGKVVNRGGKNQFEYNTTTGFSQWSVQAVKSSSVGSYSSSSSSKGNFVSFLTAFL